MTRNVHSRQAWVAAAIFAVAGFFASTSEAADDSGFYARGWVGLSGIGTDDLTATVEGLQVTADTDFSAGFTGGGAFGYRYNKNLRAEVDINYRSAENDEVRVPATEITPEQTITDGNFASLTFGVNGIYEFPNGSKWTPYVGGGLAWVQEVDIDFEDESGEVEFEGDEFGFTVLGGVRWQPTDGPWFFDAEFRYMGVGEVDLDGGENGTVTADYDPWSLNVGFGFRF